MKEVHWQVRDTIAVLLVPFELAVATIFGLSGFGDNTTLSTILSVVLRVVTTCAIIYLFWDVFRSGFLSFRKKIWLKLPVCLGAALLMPYVLQAVRSVTMGPQSFSMLKLVAGDIPVGVFLAASLTPLLAPFLEEIVFRHVLCYRFRSKPALCAIMCILSAFLFGAVHLRNFDGNLLNTVPYMVIALLYNLIYLFTKNIWYSLSTHFLFNFMQSTLPLIQVLLMPNPV